MSLSGLQSFLLVQAPMLARPSDCTHHETPVCPGRPGRLRHAELMRLPNMSRDIATRLNRATGAAGLSPAGSRPCRLLRQATFWRLVSVGRGGGAWGPGRGTRRSAWPTSPTRTAGRESPSAPAARPTPASARCRDSARDSTTRPSKPCLSSASHSPAAPEAQTQPKSQQNSSPSPLSPLLLARLPRLSRRSCEMVSR